MWSGGEGLVIQEVEDLEAQLSRQPIHGLHLELSAVAAATRWLCPESNSHQGRRVNSSVSPSADGSIALLLS